MPCSRREGKQSTEANLSQTRHHTRSELQADCRCRSRPGRRRNGPEHALQTRSCQPRPSRKLEWSSLQQTNSAARNTTGLPLSGARNASVTGRLVRIEQSGFICMHWLEQGCNATISKYKKLYLTRIGWQSCEHGGKKLAHSMPRHSALQSAFSSAVQLERICSLPKNSTAEPESSIRVTCCSMIFEICCTLICVKELLYSAICGEPLEHVCEAGDARIAPPKPGQAGMLS